MIFYTTAYIDHNYIHHNRSGIIFQDNEKAFDWVRLNGLLYKTFNKFDIPTNIKKLLSNYIKDRSYKIAHNNKLSNSFCPMQRCLRDQLYPQLYSLFMLIICQLPPYTLQFTWAADDINFLTSSNDYNNLTRTTNRELNNIITWQEDWFIKSSLKKTLQY